MNDVLERLEKEYIARHFEFHPGSALLAGEHRHDHTLEDHSEAALGRFLGDLERIRASASALDTLAGEDLAEREALLARIDGTMVDYRDIRVAETDPSFLAESLSSQLNAILIFDYAPLEERGRTVVAKERLIPAYVETAMKRMQPAAPILQQYGVRGIEGALTLVRRDLPQALAGVSAELRQDLAEATRIAVAALESWAAWLRAEKPAAERSYALGQDRYARWLGAHERVTTPLADLEAWARNEIAAHRDALAEAAARIDGVAGPAAVVERLTAEHPATGQVVIEATRIAEEVYRWLEGANVVTLPSAARVRIADTPEFMRWSFGSMWAPGPYEKPGVQSTFYATDADPAWPLAQQNEHLTAFSYRGLENLAIHEAYPGHFVQGLHHNQVVSPIRRTFWWGVFGEGWAHYCELMALEQGFADGAPEARVVQLQEALTRLCRFVNGIRVHVDPEWDFARGTRFFMDNAWLTEAVARAECERAAFDPFYLRYTLGKKQILELREECRGALGARFDLKAFHDALLGCGSAPMAVLRELTLRRLGVATS